MLWVERERGWEGKESSAIMDGEVAWDGIEGDDDTINETDNSIVESVKPNPDWFIFNDAPDKNKLIFPNLLDPLPGMLLFYHVSGLNAKKRLMKSHFELVNI